MRGHGFCALLIALVVSGCNQSSAPSTPSSTAGHTPEAGSASTNPSTTISNQMGSPTTPPQAVRQVHLGMTQAAVEKLIGFPEQAALARGFNTCGVYQNASGIAYVCFRHNIVAFKTGPGTYTKELRALNRAAPKTSASANG